MRISKPTKVELWSVSCDECGYSGVTYALAGDTYGRFMGRSINNELAEFNCWEDPVFEEIRQIVTDIKSSEGIRAWNNECLLQALSLACDPAPSGNPYEFTGRIRCPVCGSANVRYGPLDPPKFEVIELPRVTHERWERLSEEEKRGKIREALREVGCL